MSAKQWLSVSDGHYQITGALDRESVPALWRSLCNWKVTSSTIEISLEQVERVDSAGMVMLIHLLEHAKKQNCHIMLSFVPKQLLTLFQLSNVEEFIDGHLKN
ncbi:STAS domain-containing protein [Vibrio coralliilyticus]|jgi:phospholipid transport system transporter-binding protein|uniref:STAS domain-containing protein n=1 Tax=Vibrio coralliilyticus TaxID=190893 RepID=UPI0009C31A18|nr:STAS domain-containing protein [Vibrio coralliilyticus]ARC91272.1 NTP-binding protein [Vibrio coralliilyticus]NOI78705.1 STAS domain-containing protein [Vibrio coralliilyticus]NRF17252.1 STAS domain-containing protein [Vibrio coralliilyticus]NRF27597.1 STAS domain-containing protein [Vibrio coralliilyticus]NRF32868.1 STAS domain-containing protein [Vibrio coralliilyticus]